MTMIAFVSPLDWVHEKHVTTEAYYSFIFLFVIVLALKLSQNFSHISMCMYNSIIGINTAFHTIITKKAKVDVKKKK